ncbi:hypothetical protein N7468_006354 [Penicillium chermesinum]|uniref:Uncharacterized protein n=1 Tax=Penicillium chermesinum TaxID=63820 RepID=A0A9W9NUW0_9EURO|nr:uncharacterized protein N7468_006354 [Penicillium chermesinum]KAJ5225129.1 hypothetical protein N7468_006354 [Penicillium chermesinum]
MVCRSSVRKNNLTTRIEEEGFRAVIPCERCVRLKRVCFRAECSDKCLGCIAGGGRAKCVMSKPTYSDAEWRKLVKMQQEIAAQRKESVSSSYAP